MKAKFGEPGYRSVRVPLLLPVVVRARGPSPLYWGAVAANNLLRADNRSGAGHGLARCAHGAESIAFGAMRSSQLSLRWVSRTTR